MEVRSGLVKIKDIGDEAIVSLQNRDLGFVYSYVDHVIPFKFRPRKNSGIYLRDRLVGFSMQGAFKGPRTGKSYGEVGMVYVTKDFQDLGLGSLLTLHGQRELLDIPSVDAIFACVGDKTGKVSHLLRRLGFEFKEKTGRDKDQEAWYKYFDKKTEEEYRSRLEEEIDQKLAAVMAKREQLLAALAKQV